MSQRKTLSSAAALALCALIALLLPSPAAAAPRPVWKLTSSSQPTNLIAGSSGAGRLLLVATNVGGKASTGEITITDTLPAGLTPVDPGADSKDPTTAPFSCATVAQTVTCKSAGPVRPGYPVWAEIPLNVTAPTGSSLNNEAEISGGGAVDAKVITQTLVSAETPLFDFLPREDGFRAPLIEEDGTPVLKLAQTVPMRRSRSSISPPWRPGALSPAQGICVTLRSTCPLASSPIPPRRQPAAPRRS